LQGQPVEHHLVLHPGGVGADRNDEERDGPDLRMLELDRALAERGLTRSSEEQPEVEPAVPVADVGDLDELQLDVTGNSEMVSAPAVLTLTVSTALSAPPVVGMLQPLRLKRTKA